MEQLDSDRIVLMDIEGTLTPDDKQVPENPTPEHFRRVLDGETVNGDQNIGYWSGLNLLAGETPSEYFERVEKWWNDEISLEKFEGENVEKWNLMLRDSDYDSARELVNWYNTVFLDLRTRSEDLVEVFKRAGYEVGIISHTSESLSVLTAQKLGADFVVPAWKFRFEDGEFAFTEKEVYADEKSEIIDEMEEAGVEEVVFVGNGQNDVDIANRADMAYMVDNEEEVDYEALDAFTGSFNEILEQARKDMGAKVVTDEN